MAAIIKWEKDVGSMTTEKIQRMVKAFDVLKTWELFDANYKEMQLLRTILLRELGKRKEGQ